MVWGIDEEVSGVLKWCNVWSVWSFFNVILECLRGLALFLIKFRYCIAHIFGL